MGTGVGTAGELGTRQQCRKLEGQLSEVRPLHPLPVADRAMTVRRLDVRSKDVLRLIVAFRRRRYARRTRCFQ